MDMERFCRECAAPLAGRSDKQFCCDDCRTAFHNRRYRMEQKATNTVNGILRRNRRLLAALLKAGISSISLADSRVEGYDCRYFTAIERRMLRQERYHCYEYSYELKGGRICRLRCDAAT